MSGMHGSFGPVVEHPRTPAAVQPARVLGYRRGRALVRAGQPREVRIGRDLAEIRALLQRKLAWYGLHTATVGPFRRMGEGTLLCELLTAQGSVLSRVSVDRRSGAIRIARDGRSGDSIPALCAAISAAAAALVDMPSRQWHPMAGPHPTD
jgi:hypothetical protein